ncbi:MAG: sulfatase-like hydrolase/transferase [Planctomycetota bacterium]|jgi:arylsulfatase A-like enzyme
MTHRILALLLSLPLLSLPSTAQDTPLRVLLIGNSYTYYNDLHLLLSDLPKQLNGSQAIEAELHCQGGFSLRRHWESAETRALIAGGDWDFVVLQGHSQAATNRPEELADYAARFNQIIRDSGAETVLMMTWARQHLPASQATISAVYRQLATDLDCRIAPVGEVWQVALAEQPTKPLHHEDRSHPNPRGSFLAACVLYVSLFGEFRTTAEFDSSESQYLFELSQRGLARALPNIIYILADDMGYGDVSCFNEQAAWKTPAMDRLAAEGMVFTDAHSPSAVCTPTRYGILTGRYAWRTRLKSGVLGGASTHLIDPERATVASTLRDQGYTTACIGKWHLGWDFSMDGGEIDFAGAVQNGPDVNGFDEYFCHNGSLDMAPYVYVQNGRVTAAPDRITENKDYQGFWRKGATGADFVHAEVLPTFTAKAVDFVRRRAEGASPFFLYLALAAPHTPILPSEEFAGKSGTNAYGDFVLQVDDCIDQVMRAVEDVGVAENTIFIVTSDNGCSPRAKFDELADHGHLPSHVYRGHKADIYEGGHRVPFILRWPQVVKAGSSSAETISLTDLMRTAADLVGAELPDDAAEDSVSILPLLRDEALAGPLRESTIHHSINGSFAIRRGKWKLALCPGSGGWSAPRPADAFARALPLVQLFDLESDPGEERNLAAEHPEMVAELIDLLEEQVERGRSTPGAVQANFGEVSFLPKGYQR